jgi:biotin carboxyl carrier protein
MSDYYVSINNHEYQVKIKGTSLLVNNQPVENNLVPLNGNGLHMLDQGQRSLEMTINSKEVDSYEVMVSGRRFLARVQPERPRKRRRNEIQSAGELRAPMPGLVVNVMVNEGECVSIGQTLVVLESMKMQMQMRSAVAGLVSQVAVKPGQQVTKNTLMVLVKN